MRNIVKEYNNKKIRWGKKGVINLFEIWAELFFFILLVIGFLVALASGSAVISYIVIFLCGMMAGRFMCERAEKIKFPYYMILVGFLIGYILGSRYGNKSILLTLFILGAGISYYIHSRGFLHDVPF